MIARMGIKVRKMEFYESFLLIMGGLTILILIVGLYEQFNITNIDLNDYSCDEMKEHLLGGECVLKEKTPLKLGSVCYDSASVDFAYRLYKCELG